MAAAFGAAGCRATEEKRVFQYLNDSGFGTRASGDANTENYLVIGDSVSISDTIHPELKVSPQEVDVDGTISLPDVGQVNVLGMTRRRLEAFLTETYATLYERNDFKVEIRSAAGTSGKKYFVVGEVGKQGAVAFEGDKTIIEAVLEAGPKEETANLSRVLLIRGDPVDPLIITINFHDFIDYGDTTYNVLVRENDIVYIPPTFIGTIGNFVKRLIYPITVVVQPLQSLIFLFAVQNRNRSGGGGGGVF